MLPNHVKGARCSCVPVMCMICGDGWVHFQTEADGMYTTCCDHCNQRHVIGFEPTPEIVESMSHAN